MRYYEIKEICQKRIDDLPLMFAFSEKQFQEGLAKLGCQKEDLYKLPGGGFIRKVDNHLLKEAMEANEKDMKDFLATDEGMLDALQYELANHEYCINYDAQQVLDVLDLDINDERVQRLLPQASEKYLADVVY